MTEQTPLIFEYPCNEQLRAYLRIEQLFEQINKLLLSDDGDKHIFAIQNMFTLIDFMHRNDIKSSVLKNLDSRITEYVVLESRPEVDVDKLENFLLQLRNLQQWIYKHQGKFGQYIKDNEFWSSLKRHFEGRQQLVIYEVPQLTYFLNLEPERRRQMLTEVLEEFQSIKTSINVLLNLLRSSAPATEQLAVAGFYQHDINKQSCQLIRVQLPKKEPLFPEFSVGNHRFIIRFRALEEEGKTPLFERNIHFNLSLCH